MSEETKGSSYQKNHKKLRNALLGILFCSIIGYVTITSLQIKAVEVKSIDTNGFAGDVFVENGYAFVADGSYGLAIINLSTDSVIYKNTLDYAESVVVHENIAFIADGNSGLSIINVSNPSNPGNVISIDTPGNSYSVAVLNDICYLADANKGLAVINVSSIENPVILDQISTLGTAFDVVVKNGIAYVACYDMGVAVINVTDPTNLTILQYIKTQEGALDVALYGDYVYVTGAITGIGRFNIQDPSNIGSFEISPNLAVKNDVFVGDGIVMACTDENSIQYISISQFGKNLKEIRLPTNTEYKSIFFSDGKVYLSSTKLGVTIYDFNNPYITNYTLISLLGMVTLIIMIISAIAVFSVLIFNIKQNIYKRINSNSIFLSYALNDGNYFRIAEIADFLEKDQKIEQVYYFDRNIEGGKSITDYMKENIKKCNIILFFCSENSSSAEGLKAEINMAEMKNEYEKMKAIPVFKGPEHVINTLKKDIYGIKFDGDNFEGFLNELLKFIFKK